MKNNEKPIHPGKVLLEEIIKPSGMTVTESARRLGVTRKALNDLIHEKSDLSVTMALRIAFATGTDADEWYQKQVKLDLWLALKKKPKNVVKFDAVIK